MFAKNNNPKEDTVTLYETLDSDSLSRSGADNYSNETRKISIAYNSDSSDDDESSSIFIGSEENNRLNGCRDAFIINKVKPNIKSNIK